MDKKTLVADRRRFLEFLGGSATLLGLGSEQAFAQSTQPTPASPQTVTKKDDVVLESGFAFDIIARFGDKLNPTGETFGFDNDFTAFVPDGDDAGFLWVNHEQPNPLFVSGYDGKGERTRAQVDAERLAVGGSILRLIRDPSTKRWRLSPNDPMNRRVSGATKIPFVSPRPIAGAKEALGTLGNCSGGITPWGSILTCEENFQEFYGDVDFKQRKDKGRFAQKPEASSLGWEKIDPQPPEHYGWTVEVNLRTGEAKKLTALGRFCHEGAKVVRAKDGRAVVYMGDDAVHQCLYKFIADKPGSLETGQLYVANTQRGVWLPLDITKNKDLKAAFRDQTEVLIFAREAARIVGGTPLDRPEGIDVQPTTGAVVMSLTNNVKAGNLFGALLKIEEKDQDHLAMEFKASTLLSGGPHTGFACPDNIAFDKRGNLWFTTDMSESVMHKGPYATFGNNGLFYVSMTGSEAGMPRKIASAPIDAEFTGPSFSTDGRTLFLAVQHPGGGTTSLTSPTSRWPHDKDGLPRPSVVAIYGGELEKLTLG